MRFNLNLPPRFPSNFGLILSQALIILLVILQFACMTESSAEATPTQLARQIVFYDWEGDMPQSVLEDFTREYQVGVDYRFYESQEEAIRNIEAGEVYDVVVMESRFVPLLADKGLLASLDHKNIPNLKNVRANFRELAYDPENRYSIPFNWGTTGLVVRSDLIAEPVDSWDCLWDDRYAGKVGIWRGQPRETIGFALKLLGYSANSEDPRELEEALTLLLELKDRALVVEDYDSYTSAGMLAEGLAYITMGFAYDAIEGHARNPAVTYVLPKEGPLLWGDNFVIPSNSPNQYTAELFVNFLMRPEINARITNENMYATSNEAAFPYIRPEILNNPIIFPPMKSLEKSEVILPLSVEGQALYDEIWDRLWAGNE